MEHYKYIYLTKQNTKKYLNEKCLDVLGKSNFFIFKFKCF